jgi:hypothetical protein
MNPSTPEVETPVVPEMRAEVPRIGRRGRLSYFTGSFFAGPHHAPRAAAVDALRP